MRRPDTRLLVALLVLAAALHFFRLSEPRSVVFDEVHFGGFVSAYCASGSYFFDIHPPHAKLLIAAAAALGGYQGDQSFQNLGEPITRVSPALLRGVPALAGSLIPALLFVLMQQLGATPAAALLAALAALLENALLVQTRVVALDGVLLVASFGSLAAFLAALRAAGRPGRTAAALGAGMLAGLAVGTKFTGLAALALIGVCLAVDLLHRPDRTRLRTSASLAVWVLTGAVLVYAAGWIVHFALLTEPGPGFAWARPGAGLVADTVEIHRQMLLSNYGLTSSHPDASPWWSWPLMLRPVLYWTGPRAALYFLGNPVVWWGSSLGLVIVLAQLGLVRITDLREPESASSQPRRLWIPLLGYVLSLGPLTRIPRPLFLYHYLTPLLFSVCVVLLWLDRVGWTRPGGWRRQRLSVGAGVAVLAIGFVAMSPLTFAFLEAPAWREWIVRAWR